MVATWLTELWLDRINRALLEEGGEAGEEHQALTAQLRAFLAKYVETLDAHTTSALLASYGRMDDLVHFATCRQVTTGPISHAWYDQLDSYRSLSQSHVVAGLVFTQAMHARTVHS